MKNWKTTLGGVLFAAGKVAQMQSDPTMNIIGHTLEAVSVAWLGFNAMDK